MIRIPRILWKRRWWLLAPFLLIAGLTTTKVLASAPVYQASAKVLLASRDRALSAISADVAELSALTSISRTGGPLETQMEVIKSAPVVETVIRRANLQHPKKGRLLNESEFLGQAKVSVLKGTDIIQIAFTDRNPELAQRVANTWVDVFMSGNRSELRHDAANVVALLERQVTQTHAQLAKTEADLTAYQEAHGAIDLAEAAKTQLQAVAALEVEERQVIAMRGEAETHARALRARIGLNADQALAASALSQASTLQVLRKQLLEAETNPLLTQSKLTPDHPQVQELQAQVALLRQKLATEATRVVGRRVGLAEGDATLDPVRQALAQELIKAEVDALGYQTRQAALRELIASANRRLGELPEKTAQITRLERQASILAEQYRVQLKKLDEARIGEASKAENMRVVELAAFPEAPVGPSKRIKILLGLLAGLLAGLACAFLRDGLDQSVQSPDQAEGLLGVPTLGAFLKLRSPEEAALVAHTQPDSRAAEAYRNARLNLRFRLKGPLPLRSLAVCSPRSGDGRSTVAANLAVSFAQTGARVLLVDADMRLPSQHARFGLPLGPGLAELLAGEATLEAVVRPGPEPTLHVLCAGTPKASPPRLLEGGSLTRLIAEMGSKYDLVLFDTPPLLAVTDARILSALVDGAVLVARLDKTPRRLLQRALSMLRVAGTDVPGAMVLGLRRSDDRPGQSYFQNLGVSAAESAAS